VVEKRIVSERLSHPAFTARIMSSLFVPVIDGF